MITQEAGANVMLHVVAGFGLSPDDVWCMPAASAWVVVLMNTFSLANGMTTVIPDGAFQIGSFLADIERFRVTSVLMVPTMLRRAIVEQQARKLRSVVAASHRLRLGAGDAAADSRGAAPSSGPSSCKRTDRPSRPAAG